MADLLHRGVALFIFGEEGIYLKNVAKTGQVYSPIVVGARVGCVSLIDLASKTLLELVPEEATTDLVYVGDSEFFLSKKPMLLSVFAVHVTELLPGSSLTPIELDQTDNVVLSDWVKVAHEALAVELLMGEEDE